MAAFMSILILSHVLGGPWWAIGACVLLGVGVIACNEVFRRLGMGV